MKVMLILGAILALLLMGYLTLALLRPEKLS